MGRQGARYEPRDEQMETEVCRITRSWLNQGEDPEENFVLFLGRGNRQLVVMNQGTFKKLIGAIRHGRKIQN